MDSRETEVYGLTVLVPGLPLPFKAIKFSPGKSKGTLARLWILSYTSSIVIMSLD